MLPLTPILPNMRRLESEILAEFETACPRLIGALYDLVAGILRELPNVNLTQMPRLADFTRIGVAVERVLNYPAGAFLSAMNGNAEDQNDEVLQASPIALAVIALMNPDSPFYKTAKDMLPEGINVLEYRNPWQGTANRLLTLLTSLADDETKRIRTWPRVPRSLGTMLRRIAPNLRAAGIDVAFDRGRERNIILTRKDPGGATDVTGAPTLPLGEAPGAMTQTVWPAPQMVAATTQNEPAPYGYTEYRDDGDDDDAGYQPDLAGNYQPHAGGYPYIPETDMTDLFPGVGPAQGESTDPYPGRYDDEDNYEYD